MSLDEAIPDYRLGALDGSAANGLLAAFPVPLLCTTLSSMLKTGEGPLIDDVCLVIRNCALLTADPGRAVFCAELVSSSVIQDLDANLFSDDHFTRCACVYALGKLCSRASLPALQTAFSTWRDRDPLLMPELVFEMVWLGGNRWELLDQVIASPVYPTRWSAIGQLEGGIGTVGDAEKYDPRNLPCLQRLRRDDNGFVRDEANHCFALLTADIPRGISRGERRRRTQALRAQEPSVTFAKCSIQFGNYLSRSGQRSYQLDQLLKFIDHLALTQKSAPLS
jgi:hypothetical protein